MLSLLLLVPTSGHAYDDNDILCMALNVYHEARSQSLAGQVAVMHVVKNRMADKHFPSGACEVIYQGPTRKSWKNNGTYIPIRNRCQFSWWCDGKSDKPRDAQSWDYALSLAEWFTSLTIFDFTDGALFYHAYYVTPGWAKKKERTGRIEDHIFYKWKG